MIALLKLIGVRGGVGLAAGLALMAGWERLPWGAVSRADRAEAASAAKSKALRKASDALADAAKAIDARDTAISENAAREALDATDTASFWKGQARAAFQAGYASRRCDGASTDRVHDLRELWQDGAYPGSSDVPGKSGG